jgi:hypothetical protein
MTQNIIKAIVALGVVAVILLGGLLMFGRGTGQAPSLGGAAYEALTKQFGNGTQGGIIVGNGTQLTQVLKGTGNMIGADTSQAATSSAPYDIAVPGVLPGDLVFAQLSTTTQNATSLRWSIEAAIASSTNGFITVRLSNGTGVAAKPSATSVGSSTQFVIIR